MSAPIFVVGLPRSGSTLLSRLLNESPEILSLNDLYYLQAVFAADATEGRLSETDAQALLAALMELLLTRGSKNNAFIGQFELSPEQIESIRLESLNAVREKGLDWAGLMDEALGRATGLLGKSRWADKTPQNFMHMEMLRQAFPGIRFIFLLRDPRTTLVSFKYAAGPGHDPRRYHPLAYALYWRTAARKLMSEKEHEDVMVLRFEDLLQDVEGTATRLSEFLGEDVPAVNLTQVGNNSSFAGKRRKPLSETETWLVQRICGTEMQGLGYEVKSAAVKLVDLPEMLWLTLRFTVFQASRILFSADGRKRIATLVRNIFRS